MAGFLYYIPGISNITTETLSKAGLAHLGAVESRGVMKNGPDGGGGVVMVAKTAVLGATMPKLGYFAGTQTWKKAPGRDFWLGTENGNAPGPLDLQRDRIVPGHVIELGDQNVWTVPLARFADGVSHLDTGLALDDKGKWIEQPLARYAALSELAERSWATVLTTHGIEVAEPVTLVDDDELADSACLALGFNYRLSRPEVARLGLLTRELATDVLSALVDLPTVERVVQMMGEKKKESESTGDGSN